MKIVQITDNQFTEFCTRYNAKPSDVKLTAKDFKLQVGEDYLETDENNIQMLAYMNEIISMEQVDLKIKEEQVDD